MNINIRKSNHSKRQKNKKSEFLYVVNDKKIGFKKVILTRDTELIKSNPYLDFETHKYYLGENNYFEMLNFNKSWVTHFNKNIKFNYKKSIQIEVSNVKGTPKLIFEDNSMIYDVENIKLEDKEYCRINLIEYDINLYLPTNIEIVTIN